MNPGISLSKIWFDDDMVKLKIDSFDGNSLFSTNVYVGHEQLNSLVAGLSIFKDHVHGGIYDIELGSFGREYASGAFRARLHFQERGQIYITLAAQSEFEEFGRKNVASEATLYLRSEPALLDNFIGELKALTAGKRDDANLEAA